MRVSDPTFHALCIVADTENIQAARQGAWKFHKQDCPRFTDTVEMMLTGGLSPTGSAPATHYICTRHDTAEALARIEVYKRSLESAGKPHVPVDVHLSTFTFVRLRDTDDLKEKTSRTRANRSRGSVGSGWSKTRGQPTYWQTLTDGSDSTYASTPSGDSELLTFPLSAIPGT